jgi:hypothetical protein
VKAVYTRRRQRNSYFTQTQEISTYRRKLSLLNISSVEQANVGKQLGAAPRHSAVYGVLPQGRFLSRKKGEKAISVRQLSRLIRAGDSSMDKNSKR